MTQIPHPCVMQNGQPTAVIVPIDEYNRLLDAATVRAAERAQRVLADSAAEWTDVDEALRSAGASRIAAARKAAGLTQKQLAAKVGVDQAQISRLERHPERSSLSFIMKVAAAIGVPTARLV
ncbi:MAG: helix-turn-helix domain-containing protein [Phycisphaerales bacterium]